MIASINVVIPRTKDAALATLAENAGKCTLLAGGTDLMVALEDGRFTSKLVVDLSRLTELRFVRRESDELVIGALATYTDLLRSPHVAQMAPELVLCAREVGAAAIQNRGTLAGSVANASPAGDPLPVLLARDAGIEVASVRGTRTILATQFFVGYRRTALAPDEMITAIRIPAPKVGERFYWRKVGTRRAQSIAKMVLALRATATNGTLQAIAIGVGCAGPTPLRTPKTEALVAGQRLDKMLIDEARRSLAAEVAPIDDLRSTAVYRRRVAGNVLATFLASLT